MRNIYVKFTQHVLWVVRVRLPPHRLVVIDFEVSLGQKVVEPVTLDSRRATHPFRYVVAETVRISLVGATLRLTREEEASLAIVSDSIAQLDVFVAQIEPLNVGGLLSLRLLWLQLLRLLWLLNRLSNLRRVDATKVELWSFFTFLCHYLFD